MGNTAGNRVGSAQVDRILNQRCLVLIEQHSIEAAIKRILSIHSYRCQAEAEVERGVSNIGDTTGNRDAEQSIAIECTIKDAGNAVGNCITSAQTTRILNKRDFVLVEQDSIYTSIEAILRIHHYRCQAGAIVKCRRADGSDAAGNRNIGQAGTTSKHSTPKAVDAIRDCDAG